LTVKRGTIEALPQSPEEVWVVEGGVTDLGQIEPPLPPP